MPTRHRKISNKNKTKKRRYARGGAGKKKWTTAIEAAQKTMKTTGSYEAARKKFRQQALTNARKLFGAVSSI